MKNQIYIHDKMIQYACILLYLEYARTLAHADKRETAITIKKF